jgi:photosystem II stability/assembly factor-like uncharacterized protein
MSVIRPLLAVAAAAALPLTLASAQRWQLQVTGVNSSLRGVSVASDSVVWASGSGSVILRSATAGDGWTRLAPPKTDNPLDFRDVDAVSESTAYVLSIGAGALSRIYKTTDAGANWTLQFTNDNPKAFYDAMAFWDADRGVAFSDSVNGEFVLIATTDGGKTWERIPADRFPPALANEGAFAASGTNVAVWGTDHVWVGTGAAASARVLRSTDRGATWQVAATPLAAGPSAGIYSIAFRDAQHGIVVGGDYAQPQQATDNAAVTSDGGATWTLVKGLGGFRSVVAHVPGSTSSWLAVGPTGADVSHDDGRTWTPIEGPGFHTLGFAPGKPFGWAAGSGGRVAKIELRRAGSTFDVRR